MAFITKYNFKRIHADPKTVGKGLMMENCEELLYPNQVIDWFSDLEATRLFLCKILLLEPGHALFTQMIHQKWLKIYTPADNFRRATKPKAPSYHTNKACEGLHQPFRDFELPVGFVEIYGEAGVIRFRKWLNSIDKDGQKPFDVFEHKPERFKIKCEALWPRVSWDSVLLERKENSGTLSFEHYTTEEIKLYINNLMDEYAQWLTKLTPTERKAVETFKRRSAQKGLSFHDLDSTVVSTLMAKFQKDFKKQMAYALLSYYYKMAMENDNSVDEKVLEHLGFKPCGHEGCSLHELSPDDFSCHDILSI